MTQKIRNIIVAALSLAVLFAPVAITSFASAAPPDVNGGLCSGATNLQVTNSPGAACSGSAEGTQFNQILTNAVNIFSVIVGIIAVIMIIVGGLRYITSGGDSSKVSGAKTTIIYAIVGLIIVAVAQFLVKFVLSKASQVTTQ